MIARRGKRYGGRVESVCLVLQECMRRTRNCYEGGRFPPVCAAQDWTITAVNLEAPFFRVATPTTAEKWYLAYAPGRMLRQDALCAPVALCESPWRELMLPHHQWSV